MKFVTGAGNASKDQIMMSVYKHWGFEAKTNNIADAIGLAMFGLGCAGEKFSASSLSACSTVLAGQPEEVKALLQKFMCN